MSTYDLTGSDPVFLREDVRFAVFEVNQRLTLGEPAFADSIEVVWLDGVTNPTLVEGVQWRTTYEDRDYAAMSEAKLIDENFSSILVKSIENLDVPAGTRVYAVQYQALKLKPSQEDPGAYGPNPTPGLLTELINNVNYLMNVKNPLSDLTSDAIDGIKALETDVTGVNSNNLITDERHYVDVPNNKMIIHPSGGSFWEHDVVVTNVTTGLPLTLGVDYKFIGWDKAKQAIAEHTSQVYSYIFLLAPIVGNVDVTYRAFGGEATIADINAIKDVLAEITNILVDGDLLSAEALPYTGTVVDIITRLNEVEDATRHYNHATHQFQAEADGIHWFTIAALYRDVWDTQTLESGQIHLTIRSWTQKWNYDLLLSVNVSDKSNKVKVKTFASADVNNTFTIGRYENLPNRNIPQIRAVWNDPGFGNPFASGFQIQVGMEMVALQPEVLTVYDRSGSGSDFVIRDHVVGTDTVYDDNVVLPNGEIWEDSFRGVYVDNAALVTAIPTGKPGWWVQVDSPSKTIWQWNETNTAWEDTGAPHIVGGIDDPVSRFDYQTIFPQEGYLLWGGNIPMHRIQDASWLISNVWTGSAMPYGNVWNFDPSKIETITVKVYDRVEDLYRTAVGKVIWSKDLVNQELGPAFYNGKTNILFFTEDLCSLYISISKSNSVIASSSRRDMVLIANLGTYSSTNQRFDLREIVAN